MAESKLTIDERHAGDVTTLLLRGQMLLDDGDLIVITAGTAVNVPGTTNVIKVDYV